MDYDFNQKYKKNKKKTGKKKGFKGAVLFLALVIILGALLFFFFITNPFNSKNPDQQTSSTTRQGETTNPSGTSAPGSTTSTQPEEKPVVNLPEKNIKFEIGSSVNAKYAVVYDAESGTIIAEKSSEEKTYIASLTKLMTALIVVENTSESDIFTAGTELSFVQPDSSVVYLEEGQKLSRQAIIDAILLSSGNDASYTAARFVGEKVGGEAVRTDHDALLFFVSLMNKKAEELGASATQFSNVDGYHENSHYTTAKDTLLIAIEAQKNPVIKASVAKTHAEYTIESGETFEFYNTNMLLRDSDYYYNGITGMKTGTTDEAGNCLAASATRDGRSVIVITLGSESSEDRWADATYLLDSAFAAAP